MQYAVNPRFDREQSGFEVPIWHRFADAEKFLESVTSYKSQLAVRDCHSVIAREGAARAASNAALRNLSERMKIHDLNLSWCDESLAEWAQAKAEKCAKLAKLEHGWFLCCQLVESYGLRWPVDIFGHESAIARASNERWWRRQARVLQRRAVDQIARDLRTVHRHNEVYCADWTVSRRAVQKGRNRALLEGLQAVNDDGQAFTLADLSSRSTSNPENRRHELMTRMRGFEEVAEDRGHMGLFVTITTPSRFHPMSYRKHGSVQNPKYDGSTPRDAQAYLNDLWQRARAKAGREGVRFYGFRVVEPHHDGTPHWHMMLFVRKADARRLRRILRRYALMDSPTEPGARKHRFTVVEIDPAKGSATGYMSKYIAKNIDGHAVGVDYEAGSWHDETWQRVEAWASTWGIRQFQQIGGPSVTVWRELRRLDGCEDELPGGLDKIRDAADSSHWGAFVMLMGGPTVRRDDQPIRCARWLEHKPFPNGECIDSPVNTYGEPSKGRVFGLRLCQLGQYVMTRLRRWVVSRVEQVQRTVEQEYEDFLRASGAHFQASGPPLAALDLCQ